MVNAFPYHLNKRAATFEQCSVHPDAAVISNVTLSPDPPKSGSNLEVKGSATTKTNIDNLDLFALIIETAGKNIFTGPFVDICTKTECQTTTFNFDKLYNLSDLTSLPAKYDVGVLIGPDPFMIKACGVASFPE
ncbi:24393_t:CDS:1 [Cetraspora pellucida]|uniref:24393_t:CDS:1 n=1 Tax=Cetraspora pellucida TaxID=1433469 RepID=A0A9N9D2R2_9GLOM|nr:24393_t:CDS:1 [Cetraspora pellucida]